MPNKGKKRKQPAAPAGSRTGLTLAMDFDEAMRRVMQVKPEPKKIGTKRKK